MVKYQISGDHYLYATPGGAYYAVSRPADEPARRFMQRLLRERESPLVTVELMRSWSGLGEQDALGLLYHLQSSGLVEGIGAPLSAPEESLEIMLPPLLSQLSDDGKAVLAERRGLHISSAGFNHESTEEFAALGADLLAVHERHEKLLHRHLRARGDGWGLVNASGYGEIGFWPLYIGAQQLILVIGGLPQFNQPAYTTLVWALAVRYGDVKSAT